MYQIEEQCTPTRVDENKQLKLFSAFQMMHDCDDLWIDSEPYAKEISRRSIVLSYWLHVRLTSYECRHSARN